MSIRIKERPVGAVAHVRADGAGTIAARSGAVARLAVTPGREGFTPLELLDAALAGCLAISVRIAARRLGLDGRVQDVRVEVRGEKSEERPARVGRQVCRFAIEGDLTAADREKLIAEAHALCTVGHSLQRTIAIVDET